MIGKLPSALLPKKGLNTIGEGKEERIASLLIMVKTENKDARNRIENDNTLSRS